MVSRTHTGSILRAGAAFFLSLVLTMGLLPVSAFAAPTEGQTAEQTAAVEAQKADNVSNSAEDSVQGKAVEQAAAASTDKSAADDAKATETAAGAAKPAADDAKPAATETESGSESAAKPAAKPATKPAADKPAAKPAAAKVATPKLVATGHIQKRGNVQVRSKAGSAGSQIVKIGTEGQGLRLESFSLKLADVKGTSGSIVYKAHVQKSGWSSKALSAGTAAGTQGKKLRLEAVRIQLTGDLAKSFDVRYRVHAQSYGWLPWTENGKPAGTDGLSKRLESIEIALVPKDNAQQFAASHASSPAGAFKYAGLKGRDHVQGIGWRNRSAVGATGTLTLGTTGASKRLEAFTLSVREFDAGACANINSQLFRTGTIEYRAHVQMQGWQGFKKNGQTAGSTGKARRVEAAMVKLTGDFAKRYDVYCRAHVSHVGWLGWASDGANAGTQGAAAKMEALQVKLVPKGSAAPGATGATFLNAKQVGVEYAAQAAGAKGLSTVAQGKTAGSASKKAKALVALKATAAADGFTGGLSYDAHVSKKGWLGYRAGGQKQGTGSNAVQALRFKLTGELGKYFDVYYRVNVAGHGWLGWAKNGAPAGSTGLSKSVTAYQLRVVVKGAAAPGSTKNAYSDKNGFLGANITGDPVVDSKVRALAKRLGSLRACYDWVKGHRHTNWAGSGVTRYSNNSTAWIPGEVSRMLDGRPTDCYAFAATFAALAKALGYDAKPVCGFVPSLSSGWAAHSWVEIRRGGTVYGYDPDLERGIPYVSFYGFTYGNSPTNYRK